MHCQVRNPFGYSAEIGQLTPNGSFLVPLSRVWKAQGNFKRMNGIYGGRQDCTALVAGSIDCIFVTASRRVTALSPELAESWTAS